VLSGIKEFIQNNPKLCIKHNSREYLSQRMRDKFAKCIVTPGLYDFINLLNGTRPLNPIVSSICSTNRTFRSIYLRP
jgi:hypothetical protein